jgi:hypothetical protein
MICDVCEPCGDARELLRGREEVIELRDGVLDELLLRTLDGARVEDSLRTITIGAVPSTVSTVEDAVRVEGWAWGPTSRYRDHAWGGG